LQLPKSGTYTHLPPTCKHIYGYIPMYISADKHLHIHNSDKCRFSAKSNPTSAQRSIRAAQIHANYVKVEVVLEGKTVEGTGTSAPANCVFPCSGINVCKIIFLHILRLKTIKLHNL